MDVTDIPAGLNEGLVTMAQGEVASFELAAAKAHGAAGLEAGAQDVAVPPGAAVRRQPMRGRGSCVLARLAARASSVMRLSKHASTSGGGDVRRQPPARQY